ncbi:MAG: response regulator [Deltaproteobacteria bacterium]|nr:response regulator [Deltaproteobacteria bacterium]
MSQKTVLVVDDDTIIREQLAKELRRNYYEVITAAGASTAVETFNKNAVDIALLDLNLPDGDGLEVLSTFKATKPNCEVIVITGFGSEEKAIESLRRGAIDYIEKPINFGDLDTALGRAQEKIFEESTLVYKNTVLVMDDDDNVRRLLGRFLKKEGFDVLEAPNGEEGLKIMKEHKVDVFVSDIEMGTMSGVEVLKQARNLYNDIEGIMMTGHKDIELAVKSLRAGAFDYITKPIDLEETLLAIRGALERINLRRNSLFRHRELKISSEIINKMNTELERRVVERSRQLNQVQTQLFQQSKLATLGEMSAGLAHEINQPLGGISLIVAGFKRMLKKGKLTDAELQSGIKDIETSITRMSKIITHIRTFARQDALKFVEVNVNETIQSALDLLNEQLRLHNIKIVRDLDPHLLLINGEPYQLEQVWINLLANARDAVDTFAEGFEHAGDKTYQKQLKIKTISLPESQEIAVTFGDNGTGMEAAVLAKIFEPFFTSKAVGKGTGLGMAISYGIIDQHQGRFDVKSMPGEGTSVTIYLPAAGAKKGV